jgi:hypothetical protein
MGCCSLLIGSDTDVLDRGIQKDFLFVSFSEAHSHTHKHTHKHTTVLRVIRLFFARG